MLLKQLSTPTEVIRFACARKHISVECEELNTCSIGYNRREYGHASVLIYKLNRRRQLCRDTTLDGRSLFLEMNNGVRQACCQEIIMVLAVPFVFVLILHANAKIQAMEASTLPINLVFPLCQFIAARLTLSDLAAAYKKVGEYARTDVIKRLDRQSGCTAKGKRKLECLKLGQPFVHLGFYVFVWFLLALRFNRCLGRPLVIYTPLNKNVCINFFYQDKIFQEI